MSQIRKKKVFTYFINLKFRNSGSYVHQSNGKTNTKIFQIFLSEKIDYHGFSRDTFQ